MEEGNNTDEKEVIKAVTSDHIEEEIIQHLNNPVTDLKPIVKQYLTAVKGVKKEGNKFYFSDGSARVEVRVVSDEIIRVRLAPHGVFLDDFSYAVPTVDQKVTTFRLEENEDFYAISTNTITCRVSKEDFLVSFVDNTTNMVMSQDTSPMHWEENVEFGGYYVFATKECLPEENFFGLGDKSGNLNLRGRKFQNWNTDAYSFGWDQDPYTVPFLSTSVYTKELVMGYSLTIPLDHILILVEKTTAKPVFGQMVANSNIIISMVHI